MPFKSVPLADLAAAIMRSYSEAASAMRGMGNEERAAIVRPPLTTERLEILFAMIVLPN